MATRVKCEGTVAIDGDACTRDSVVGAAGEGQEEFGVRGGGKTHMREEQSFYSNKVLLDNVGISRRRAVGKVKTERG